VIGSPDSGPFAHLIERRNDKVDKLLTSESIQKSLGILIPLGIFLIILLAGYVLRTYLFSRLSRWAAKTGSRMGDTIISAVRSPFLLLCLMLGVYAALEVSKLPRTMAKGRQGCPSPPR
jgi:hypothetical protein